MPVDIAALYLRVSGALQRENWSVALQRKLENRATAGLPVVIFDEQGVSGGTIEDRRSMTELLDAIETGEARNLTDTAGNRIVSARIVELLGQNIDRLSRDEDNVDGMVIMAACRQAGIPYITDSKRYDFDNDDDHMLASLEFVVAGRVKRGINRNTIRAKYEMAIEGKWPGGPAPYGYRLVPIRAHADGRPRNDLAIDELEAEAVRLAFFWYADGLIGEDGVWRPMSQNAIALELNARGYRFRERYYRPGRPDAKRQRHTQDGRRAFGEQDIARITENLIYIGRLRYGQQQMSRHVRDLGRADVQRDDWVIVDAELFRRVKAKRQERARIAPRLVTADKALSGLLRCPHRGCGALLIACQQSSRGSKREPIRYYQCHAFRQFGSQQPGGCPGGGFSITERVALPVVLEEVRSLFARIRLGDYLDAAARDAEAQSGTGLRAALQNQLAGYEAEKDRLIKAVRRGTFTAEEIDSDKRELDEKIARVRERVAKLDEHRGKKDALALQVAQLKAGNAAARLEWLAANQPAQFRQIVALLFARVVVATSGPSRKRVAVVVDRELTDEAAEFVAQGPDGSGNTFPSSALSDTGKVGAIPAPLDRLLADPLPALLALLAGGAPFPNAA